MKIRNGFVSNSSSASYCLRIPLPLDEILDELYTEYNWNIFNKEKRKNETIKNLTDGKKYVEEFRDKKNAFFFSGVKDRIEEDKKFLEEIDNLSSKDFAKKVLERKGIIIEQDKDITELRCWTAMHNSYLEGVSDIFKEIMMYFLFERKLQIQCSVEHLN